MSNEQESTSDQPRLNATEIRILGALIEKQATSPETYPLTLNALVLACTHYPLIKEQIARYYAGQVDVLDASDVVAAAAEAYLAAHGLLAPARATPLAHHFYVSDFTRSFEESTRIFFEQEVHLEHYPLWE